MNSKDAKTIAETITNEEIGNMFENAKKTINDWSKVSNVNKGMSKGAAWNILASDFDINNNYSNLAKVNMIREFGEYLPKNLKPVKKNTNKIVLDIVHQEPKF